MRKLKAEGITGKRGKPIDKGYLYRLLNDPIYIGEAAHKGKYPRQAQGDRRPGALAQGPPQIRRAFGCTR